jgi:hypothetical protein
VGLGTPEQVGAAVVRSIERNRREITVAPLPQRALSGFAANFPEVSSRLAGGMTAKVIEKVAAGQTDKR